jgi:hypothetical protein
MALVLHGVLRIFFGPHRLLLDARGHDSGRKIDWTLRSLLAFLKIGRKSWIDAKVALFLPRETVLLDWLIGVLSAVVFVLSWIGYRLFRWRVFWLCACRDAVHGDWHHPVELFASGSLAAVV